VTIWTILGELEILGESAAARSSPKQALRIVRNIYLCRRIFLIFTYEIHFIWDVSKHIHPKNSFHTGGYNL
jgi:hypothetical protein